jgi:hypothetical protein
VSDALKQAIEEARLGRLSREARPSDWSDPTAWIGLANSNSDSICEQCRIDGKPENDCYLEVKPEGCWVVLGIDGQTYHVECAKAHGWTPTTMEQDHLTLWPSGPYA